MSIHYKTKLLWLFLCLTGSLHAQQNIAPQATVSASTCNTGACSTLNDLQFGTCGTQIMWITTGTPPSTTPGVEWIQWDWTTTRTVNRFIIHHAQTNSRFLAGALIQRWSGTAWVNVATFSNLTPACSSVVNFPTVSTNRLRITSFTMSGTQLSNPNFREIEVFGPNVNNDASVSNIPNLNTCTYTQKVDAVVTNGGRLRLDSFRLSWSVNNVFQNTQYIQSNILTGQSATYTLSNAYTFLPNTQYTIRAWTSNPNGTVDSLPSNDMFTQVLDFFGSPSDPSVTNFTQCGRGVPKLTSTTTNPADSVFWYDAASGGNLLGIGKTINGPLTIATKTFYAGAIKLSRNSKLNTTGTTGVNVRQTEPYGGMQTIVTKVPIILDSLMFRLWYATPVNVGYSLYYKTGTHVGFQTNASAWTKLNDGVANFITQGGMNYARVSAKFLTLPPGTYSFYLTTDLTYGAGNSFYSVLNGPGAINTEMDILTGGAIIIGMFASTQTLTYQPEIHYIYKKYCESANRTPLTVTVKPRPIGADVVAGAPFQGQFRLGVGSNPDVIEVGKTISYNLVTPTGYSNADHGNTWALTSVSAYTRNNRLVPSTDYTVNAPVGTTPASLSFNPGTKWLDSTITFRVNFSDYGPHFCDSFVTRTVYVAPTPKPNFTFPNSICLGESTLFENLTSIHSGLCTYKWYFDDGDSSDLNSPVHDYKAAGTYNVRLVATSFGWNVVKDTTIRIEIGEVPVVDFRVRNACEGSALNFLNQTYIGSGTLSYEWNYGDGSTNTFGANGSRIYGKPGPYKVTLTAEANGCRASKTKVAYQFAKPVASFIKQTGNCLNDAFSFTNNSSISLGQFGNKWDFDDNGNIASDKNPVYTFTTAGEKNVKLLTISEFGCRDSIIQKTLVKQTPVSNFTFPYACDRTRTPFTNTTDLMGETLLKYDWNFGGGQTSNASNPLVSWPNVGSRIVTLKTSLANGCSSEISKIITVGVQPKADFEFIEKCAGEEIIFTNLSTFSNGTIEYEWNFGDNIKSKIPSPSHLYQSGSSSQSYFVQLKASIQDGCADSIIKQITVQAIPVTCDFTIDRNWNIGKRNFTFTPTGGSPAGISYTWIVGDGNSVYSNGSGAKYNYNADLRYCVTMIAKNAADCECSTTKCVDVATSVDAKNLNETISIYPNPGNGIFNISSVNNSTDMHIQVYAVTGELILQTSMQGNTSSIDLSPFASGVYTIRISNGETSVNRLITLNK